MGESQIECIKVAATSANITDLSRNRWKDQPKHGIVKVFKLQLLLLDKFATTIRQE